MNAAERAKNYLEAIDRRNPGLGAFTHVAAQNGSGGELQGMAIAVKDNVDLAGMPAAAGMEARRGRMPSRDAACVARLRRAGATFLGKTLMDEAAFGACGNNPWFGRCHNPVRQGFTPGGSSSGSAAAVGAQLCDAAIGTDTLGSVRIPASYCGVVGYLPGRGCVEAEGVLPLMPEFDRVGVLARSVADAARVAATMTQRRLTMQPDVRASIGLVQGLDAFVAPPICGALQEAARQLALRHRVAAVRAAPFDWASLRRAALLLTEREGARVHAALLDDDASLISPTLRSALEFGRRATTDQVARARDRVAAARRWLAEVLAGCDMLLLPSTPQTAFAFDSPVPETQADLTVPASIAGLGAISVPAGTAEGLPLGLQLCGPHDGAILGVAAQLAGLSQRGFD